jgi:hypothetical protein
MKQPPGFVDSALPSHVCRLHKSLYGLKQAPRAWHTRLNDFLLSVGFRASKVDTSLFIFSVGADICYLLVYVDDILLTGSNSLLLQRLIQLLSSEFKLHDLGSVHYFLGIKVQSTSMGLMLRQHKYTLDILTRAVMLSCKLLVLLSLHPKLQFCSIHYFLMLHAFVKLWVLFNISLLRTRIFALLLTEFVSLCMLLQILIGLP